MWSRVSSKTCTVGGTTVAIKKRDVISANYAMTNERSISFENLKGGLNLWELDYRLEPDESPEMKNLFWQDGVLSCRNGQDWVFGSTELGTGHAMYDSLFFGYAVWHSGDKLYYAALGETPTVEIDEEEEKTEGEAEAEVPAADPKVEPVVLREGVPEIRGTFFRYQEGLFYKTTGAFIQIKLEKGLLVASDVEAYTPVVLINADPTTAAGDLYQPENRLTNRKELWYNAKADVKEYHLPEKEILSIDSVKVDDTELEEGEGYTFDEEKCVVTLATAAPVTTPATNNTVKIKYTSKGENAEELYNSVMECRYAAVYGSTSGLCIVMAGCSAQPNAYFWNGNNAAMDAGYWPVEQYNLAGNAADAITGFGKQQNQLLIFSERSVGKVELGTKEVNERAAISMDYTAINDKIGCDLPWTIQLIENNLVFCNTESGVHIVQSTSSAYENNIAKISKKVDGTPLRLGLLNLVRGKDRDSVCSVDDGNRYWVVTQGEAYVWDYDLSQASDPSWFYFDNIPAIAFCTVQDLLWHMDAKGRLSQFKRNFMDYDKAIEKKFRFAYQHFGTYDRKKDVNTVLLMIRSDVRSNVRVTYLCDYGEWVDKTNLVAHSHSLVPRDLSFRDLSVSNLAAVFRRRPGLRHVHHFAMELSNNAPGEDLSIVSAQVFFRYQGRER